MGLNIPRILLVEDNLGDVIFLRRALKSNSSPIEIVHVSCAEQAISAFADGNLEAISLLLVDINLPGLSGIDLMARMRSEIQSLGIPAYMLSSSQADQDIARSYANGASGYLVKPWNLDGYDCLAQSLIGLCEQLPAGQMASSLLQNSRLAA